MRKTFLIYFWRISSFHPILKIHCNLFFKMFDIFTRPVCETSQFRNREKEWRLCNFMKITKTMWKDQFLIQIILRQWVREMQKLLVFLNRQILRSSKVLDILCERKKSIFNLPSLGNSSDNRSENLLSCVVVYLWHIVSIDVRIKITARWQTV